MFPKKKVPYLRRKLSKSDGNVERLIEQLLQDQDGEDERPVESEDQDQPRPGSSREPQVNQNEVERMAKAAGLSVSQCPACSGVPAIINTEEELLVCQRLECRRESCMICRAASHSPLPCKSTITRMMPSRDIDDDNALERKFRIYESHFYRMLHDSRWSIKSIDIIENPGMKRDFERKKKVFSKKGVPAKPIFAYHGTKKTNIKAITASNFDVKKAVRQAHGPGNYFSEYPQTALGYSDDGRELIVAEILPGCSYSGPALSWPLHNSKLVQVGADGYSQMVIIEDSSQILPVAVLHF